MSEFLLIGLASVVILGVGAQWLAWRMRLPSILVLLITGFIAGPVLDVLDPNVILGNLLLPIVSISVALILFEGGLTLRLSELQQIGRTVRNLITVGALVTWAVCAVAAHYALEMSWDLSFLLGAILVVSGPTVIIPLIRHVRPAGQVGSILRWEGIAIDPVGAILAVLVYEAVFAGNVGTQVAAIGFVYSIIVGTGIGLLTAGLLYVFLKHYLIPDFLQNAVSVMMVVGCFVLANELQHESGVLAVTVMGVALANQRSVAVKHIVEFKENLRVLLISSLFIVLAARLELSQLEHMNVSMLVFLAILILAARPLAVLASTFRSELNWRERVFLMAVAPRGIVAAAVASVFGLRLIEAGNTDAERLVPITFMVIIGTVTVYGLGSGFIARWLGVAQPHPQGLLIVGAHAWARAISKAISDEGHKVLLVDSNWSDLHAARMAGLPTHYGSILSEYALDELDLVGIGRLLAITRNAEVNSLAALHFADVLGRAEVFQLPPGLDEEEETMPLHLRGRYLFTNSATYQALENRWHAGAQIKRTQLTEDFDYAAYKAMYGARALPMFQINENGALIVLTAGQEASPKPGAVLISLVDPGPEDE